MNTITQQIELMKQAIKVMDDIKTLDRLIKPVDPITYKVMVNDLRNQYIEITVELLRNFLTTAEWEQLRVEYDEEQSKLKYKS